LFSPGTPVSFTNKTNHHDISEILLKVALNTIKQTKPLRYFTNIGRYGHHEASDNFILSISLEKVEKLHNLPNQNKTNHPSSALPCPVILFLPLFHILKRNYGQKQMEF
jgi:hypothetical protein